jgi:hypothetical protein
MKFSEQTRKILENYASISTGILIPATKIGEIQTQVQCCDKNKMVIATTVVAETLANDVCLSDLKAFLNTISTLKDPEITLASDHMIINDGSFNVRIVYGDPLTVTRLKKQLELPASKYSFTLKEDSLAKLLNLSTILTLPDLRLYSTNGKIYFQVLDRKNTSTNTGAIEVGAGNFEAGEEYFFQRELLKMLPGDYKVEIIVAGSAKMSRFTSMVHDNLAYIIALSV